MSSNIKVKYGYVDVPGGQIHYRTAGDGPALLLLHPMTYSSDYFSDVIPLLAKKYRVIATDRFGHGYSSPLPVDYPFFKEGMEAQSEGGRVEPYIADVDLSVLDALGVDKFYLAGQHTGSLISIEMAIRHPERVKRLALIGVVDWSTDNPTPTYSEPDYIPPGPLSYLHIDRLQRAREVRRNQLAARVPRWDGSHLTNIWQGRLNVQGGPLSTPEIIHRMAMMGFHSMVAAPDCGPNIMLYYYASKRLPLLKVPTLIMAGEHDMAGVFTKQQRERIPKSTPSEMRIIKGAGAWSAMEKPEEYAWNLMEWFGKE